MHPIVQRKRLVTAIDDASHHVAVVACAGSGKSELALQVARDPETMLVRDLSQVPEVAPGWRLVFDVSRLDDDQHPLDDSTVAQLLLDHAASHTVVLLGRSFAEETERAVARLNMRRLGTDDLFFDHDELSALEQQLDWADPETARLMHELCAGWPSVVLAALGESAPNDTLTTREIRDRTAVALSATIDAAVTRLRSDSVTGLDAAIYLDRFDQEVATRMGAPDLIPLLQDAGLPIVERGSDWYSLLPQAQKLLMQQAQTTPTIPPKVFEHLAQRGLAIEAIESALAAGDSQTAARLFSELGIDQISVADPRQLDALVVLLGDDIDAFARSALVRAWRYFVLGHLEDTIATLEAGIDAAGEQVGETGLIEEMQAELATAHFYLGTTDLASGLVGDLSMPLFASPRARARQLEVRAGLLALTMVPKAHEDATDLFRQSADLWRSCGHFRSARRVIGALALEVMVRSGRLPVGLELLRQAVRFSTIPRDRAQDSVFQAWVLVLMGDPGAEELLVEAEELAVSAGVGWIAGYASVWRALQASYEGDAARLHRHVDNAIQGLGHIMQIAGGALAHADFVDAFARVGDAEATAYHLQCLRDHPGVEAVDLALAESVAACKVGDPHDGLQLVQQLVDTGLVVPSGPWIIPFLRSVAFARIGEDGASIDQLAIAGQVAAETGTESRPDLVAGRAQLEQSGDDRPALPERSVSISLMHEFAVRIAGVDATPPAGHQQTLLKTLALADGTLSIDAVIDALWPEVGLDIGRRRLRNVLNRVRSSCGEIIKRDGDLLRLAPDVHNELAEWTAGATAVLDSTERTARGPESATALDVLIEAAPNELLRRDQYEEWLQPRQRSFQLVLLRLLDRRAAIAAEAGHVQLAVSALTRAMEVQPAGFERVETAARLLRAEGLSAAASDFERTWLG